MSTLGALLGAMAWLLGSFVAFAIVVLIDPAGSGPLFDRLALAKFADYMTATVQVEPTWLQPAILAAFIVAGWMSARPKLPRPVPAGR